METIPETVDIPGIYNKMLERMAQDPSYQERLKTDFRSCAAELGWTYPTEQTYRAFFDSPTVHHLVIHKCPTVHCSKVRF